MTATSRGDKLSLFLMISYGCYLRSNLKLSMCPYSLQKWHGVYPSISYALMSTSLAKSALIILKLPRMQATWSGVLRFFERQSRLPPNSANTSINSTWPSFDATCIGVHPSLLHSLRRASASLRSWLFSSCKQELKSPFSVLIQILRKSSLYCLRCYFSNYSLLIAACYCYFWDWVIGSATKCC